MNKYTNLRKIRKGQLGLTLTQLGFTPIGGALPLSTIDTVNDLQTTLWKKQLEELAKLRLLLIQNNYLMASNGLNYLSQGLTNYGITSGNATLANLGQLTNTVNNGLLLVQNWNSLSNLDRSTGVSGLAGQAMDTIDNMAFSKLHINDSALTKGLNQGYNALSSSLMMFSPVGCVCAGSRVIDKLGRFVNIEDLTKDDGIVGWGDKLVRPQQIYSFKQPEYKECLRLTLNSGIILECSTDHPILSDFAGRAKLITINGKSKRVRNWLFRQADSLSIGDFVGVVNNVDIWGSEEMWNPYLIGLLIGDGTYGKDHGVRMYSADSDTWNYIEKYLLGGQINFDDSNYSKEFRAYRIFNGPEHLRELGIYELTKKGKRLPINIHRYTKDSICKLIAGLFDTDGFVFCNIEKKDYKVVFCLSNIDLINLVKELLLKLGIHSSILKIKEKTSKYKDHEIKSGISYKLIIKDKLSILNFYNLIHLNLSYKLKNLEEIALYCQLGKFKDNRELSGAKADKIKKIENIGQQLVYNLLADNDHTYIANGIITHNTIVGGAMKVGKLLGDGLTSVGVGTDLMTKTDLIFDSDFMKLTPIGLVNGIGAKKTQNFSANNDTIELVGSSYSGAVNTINDAVSKANKKYGLFSNSARHKANNLINTARYQLNLMTNISNEYLDLLANKSDLAYTRYNMDINGGYQLQYIRAAKQGAILNRISLMNHKKNDLLPNKINIENLIQEWQPIISITKFQEGGKTEEKSKNPDKKSRSIEELIELAKQKNPRFILRMAEPFKYLKLPDGSIATHIMSWGDIDGKPFIYSLIQEDENGNLQDYGKEAIRRAFKNHNGFFVETPEEAELFTVSNDTAHGYKSGWKDFFNLATLHKNGGELVNLKKTNYSTQEWQPTISTTYSILSMAEGGKSKESNIENKLETNLKNVIPEGALHAHKHNMEHANDLTKKGIPVVDNKGEQQAEVEKNEIIFNLEVTKKLEELHSKYMNEESTLKEKDELAIEAGKVLVYEILHNTEDKTGLIKECKKGGIIDGNK